MDKFVQILAHIYAVWAAQLGLSYIPSMSPMPMYPHKVMFMGSIITTTNTTTTIIIIIVFYDGMIYMMVCSGQYLTEVVQERRTSKLVAVSRAPLTCAWG